MKIAALIARILLGLIFLIFGLNKFLNFLPQPPLPPLGGQFAGALYVSHELLIVAAIEVVTAVLLLANRFVPLALTLLGPVIVNVFLFHAFMAPTGLPTALFIVILWSAVFYSVRDAFSSIFVQKIPQRA
ncbi:DoxX family membrane protein [Granulicella sp. dw_53]|uniref:DoxX family membrane protein n=1 Tax=Granulicella sp. dw_53 TaxID=2719792 RepID=UPI001BD50D4E|nr:DoxX family membrane protein [Granulicella sp. dw_53]